MYPFSRSPFRYASRTLRSDLPSISFLTMSYDIVVTLIFALCYNMVVQAWCVIWRLSWKRGRFGLGRCSLMGTRSSVSTRTPTASNLNQATAPILSSVREWIGLASVQTSLTGKSRASTSIVASFRSTSVKRSHRRTSISLLRSQALTRLNVRTAAQATFRSGVGSTGAMEPRFSVSSACRVVTVGTPRFKGLRT